MVHVQNVCITVAQVCSSVPLSSFDSSDFSTERDNEGRVSPSDLDRRQPQIILDDDQSTGQW